jgi:hypothetical protein
MSLPYLTAESMLNRGQRLEVLFFLLLVSGSSTSYAQLVLYDGAVGDADPVTQGWDLTLNANPSIASVTPDPANDLVKIKVAADLGGDPGDPRDWSYSLPLNLASLQDEVGDDSYHWTLQFQLNEFIFMGFPTGATQHTYSDFQLHTGTASGSAGYLDRVFIQAAGLRFPSTSSGPQFHPDFAFEPSKVVLPTDPSGSPPEFDITPNWNNMLDMTELTFNRVGGRVEVYTNGDLLFSGNSHVNQTSSTQVDFNDNANSERVDMNWSRFEVGDAIPLLVSTPPNPHALYDGSYFGGNPIKQGWQVEPLSPGLTLTPDGGTNSVRLENSNSNFRFKVVNGLRKTVDEATDDNYKWSVTFSADETNNESAVLKFTGNSRRETIDFQGTQIVVQPSVTGGGAPLEAAAGFDMTITPGETPNFSSMSDVNELVCYRNGDEVLITINGDIVFRGVGGIQSLSPGQLDISNTTDGGVLATDITLYGVSISTTLEGDYDGDNDVDEDDFAVWRNNFGTIVPYNPPQEIYRVDGNLNGIIDAADYTIWRDHFGETVPFLGLTVPGAGSASAVPEPSTGFLACFSMAWGAGLLRGRFRYPGNGQRSSASLHRRRTADDRQQRL